MRICNLTPHVVTLRDVAGVDHAYPSEGLARVAATPGALRAVEGIPVPVAAPTAYGDVEGLPAPVEGTIYIVSLLVLARVARSDVFAPGTGPADGAVRDARGQIVAVTRLIAAV